METFIAYIIRSSLIVTIVFMVYQLLKNDRNFTRNRIFLLSGLILSFTLPLISFIPTSTIPINGSILLEPVIINSERIGSVVNHNPDIFRILLLIYLGGIFVLVIKDGLQLWKLYRIAKRSGVNRMQGYTLVITNTEASPFSFFRLIFINKHIGEKEAATILAHEQVHADQRHSIDVLLMELLAVLQWFNPVVWYYRNMLREVHEYLADRSILHKGIEKAGYLQLLCAMALKVQPADITNSFCQIKLKRRLKMITKSQNSRFSGVKFIAMLPLLGLFIWLVSCNNSTKDFDSPGVDTTVIKKEVAPSGNNTGTETPSVNEKEENGVYTVVEDMPEYVGGNNAMNAFIASNINYPQKAKETGIQGTVYVSFHVDENGNVVNAKVIKGIGKECDEEALRVIKMMPKWKPGNQSGKSVKVAFTLPIKFALK
jgi:TonB family protein